MFIMNGSTEIHENTDENTLIRQEIDEKIHAEVHEVIHVKLVHYIRKYYSRKNC